MAVLVEGTVSVHPRGFGFLEHEGRDGEIPQSSFIAPPELEGFLQGDRVQAKLVEEADGRSKVESLSLLERARTHLFGIAERHNTTWRLRVDPHVSNSSWLLEPADDWEIEDGDGVLATIDGRRARATDAYEDPYSPEAVAVGVSVRHGIALDPPEEDDEVAAEADAVLARVEAVRGTEGATRGGRVDLRDVLTLTIDADHSLDLDDALSVEPADGDGVIRVTVHIADVAEWVESGSALDRAARAAGTSVYLGAFVRPMLPRALSEGALSLIPGAERDALSITLAIDQEGVVVPSDVFASRIRSDRRVSYLSVAGLLEGDEGHGVGDEQVADALFWLHTAAARIGTQRQRRGGISAVRLESGKSEDDGAEVAHDLIERLMVAANEAVAAWVDAHGAPGPFRSHPAPADGAGAEIDRFAQNFGFRLGLSGPLTPHSLRAVESALDASKDDRVEVIWELLLAHLGRAVYQGRPEPHFGLASDIYLHFTSPLRRYADLLVHRRCKEILAGLTPRPGGRADDLLHDHLNTQTRLAAKAEREVDRTAELVTLVRGGRLRDTFEGRIIGFAKPGVRVGFGEAGLSGLVRWRAFDRARYEIDDGGHSISSPGYPNFGLGEKVMVSISRVDLERGEVDLIRMRD